MMWSFCGQTSVTSINQSIKGQAKAKETDQIDDMLHVGRTAD